jgi:hypothetical protein
MMYVAGIGLSWHFFGLILETNLLTSTGSQKISKLVDCPGMKTTPPPCLLSQVAWTVSMLLTKLNLVVCCDRSDAGQQSWMNHSQTVPTCFGQKTGQLFSPNSVLSENDSSCMQGINCMSCGIYPRSRMPIMRGDAGDAAKIFCQLSGYGEL